METNQASHFSICLWIDIVSYDKNGVVAMSVIVLAWFEIFQSQLDFSEMRNPQEMTIFQIL